MTTTSIGPPLMSFGPNAELPVVIRTRAIRSPLLAMAPKNERLPSLVMPGNALRLKIWSSAELKNSIRVTFGKSTSENTAPKPPTVAGIAPLLPGREKVTSVILVPVGVKIR